MRAFTSLGEAEKDGLGVPSLQDGGDPLLSGGSPPFLGRGRESWTRCPPSKRGMSLILLVRALASLGEKEKAGLGAPLPKRRVRASPFW